MLPHTANTPRARQVKELGKVKDREEKLKRKLEEMDTLLKS